MIFNSHKTSGSLCGSKYVQLQSRILITCVYHNQEKINKKSTDWSFTSIPFLSSVEIKLLGTTFSFSKYLAVKQSKNNKTGSLTLMLTLLSKP